METHTGTLGVLETLWGPCSMGYNDRNITWNFREWHAPVSSHWSSWLSCEEAQSQKTSSRIDVICAEATYEVAEPERGQLTPNPKCIPFQCLKCLKPKHTCTVHTHTHLHLPLRIAGLLLSCFPYHSNQVSITREPAVEDIRGVKNRYWPWEVLFFGWYEYSSLSVTSHASLSHQPEMQPTANSRRVPSLCAWSECQNDHWRPTAIGSGNLPVL